MGNSPERTAHPAQYPIKLMRKIIECATIKGDVVFDPFMGSGTTAVAAKQCDRVYIGFELKQEYLDIANRRLGQSVLSNWVK
jgi:DNA modification methylase